MIQKRTPFPFALMLLGVSSLTHAMEPRPVEKSPENAIVLRPAFEGRGRPQLIKAPVGAEARREDELFRVLTEHFVVMAPSLEDANAIAFEAEKMRVLLSQRWLGIASPEWQTRCRIMVRSRQKTSHGSTTFQFGDGGADQKRLTSMTMYLNGPLEYSRKVELPYQLMHCLLSNTFDQPLTHWMERGIAATAQPDEEQSRMDAVCRKSLEEGHGMKIRYLFSESQFSEPPQIVHAHAHSIVRFLLSRKPTEKALKRFENPPAAEDLMLALVNEAIGKKIAWETAVREIYGFENWESFETQWIAWMKSPQSQIVGAKTPTKDTLHIPPTKLSR